MLVSSHRHNSLCVLKQVFLLGAICFSLVSCTQPTPLVVTIVPITVEPMVVTVEIPVEVTREATRQMIVTQEVTREVTRQIIATREVPVTRLVPVTVTPPPTSTPIPTPTPLPSPVPTFGAQTLAYTGQWSSAGSMTMARGLHTATVLRDGRVLLAAGRSGSYPDVSLSNAEIYDPVSGTFRAIASLNTARHEHSATLLPDGRVLVIGGYNPRQGWLSSAEIYDPATGQWNVTQPIFAHGVTHSATLLKDGRVLVMAGAIQSGSAGPDDRVEIFDPKTNRWQKAALHENTEGGHTATLLIDGRVLIAGGSADPAIYDPASDTWQPAGKLAISRALAQAVLLQDGRVLLIGGVPLPQGGTVLNSVEIYDPASNTWRQATPLAQARYIHTATLLPDGRVVIVGGWNGYENSLLDSAEVYDYKSATWSTLAPLSIGRVEHTATLLPDGRILVTGGQTSRGVYLNSAEVLGR
jgi:N-acetylneuraminic acid mutarotase